jgi:hypothetical protein
MKHKPFIAIHIVPTGLGANTGGFAGDAGAVNQLLSSCVDYMITNPNVVNAATMHNIPLNVLYTEGYSLNLFCKKERLLRAKNNNKIGVVLDQGMPQAVLNMQINAINAAKVVYGLDIAGYQLTEEPVGVEYYINEEGYSSGTIQNIKTLLNACTCLIEQGAEALAVVCMFPDLKQEDNYARGQGVDPIGGVESIISHLVSATFNLPCAHAPAFSYGDSLPSQDIVDHRAAAEYFSPVFLPCILYGLRQAPAIIQPEEKQVYDISFDEVNALVVPADCLGSVPVLSCLKQDIPIITILTNTTVLDVTAEKLGIKHKIIASTNYAEAAGYLQALRTGLSLDLFMENA